MNGDERCHKRRVYSPEGFVGSRRSQYRERVEDLTSSNGFISFMEESTEQSEREGRNRGVRRVAHIGKVLK